MAAMFLEPPPAMVAPAVTAETRAGRVTGVGGVFIKSNDPRALAAWYRDVLGLDLETWGGALMRTDAPHHPPQVVWRPFTAKSQYFAPSTRDFMLDFAVDDMDAFVARLEARGVRILARDDSDPNGRFAWIMDPDGTKIELRQAKGE
jgi:catechol 2,3-dioxygenase-like lactoylglutathione lyase family enzyme